MAELAMSSCTAPSGEVAARFEAKGFKPGWVLDNSGGLCLIAGLLVRRWCVLRRVKDSSNGHEVAATASEWDVFVS